jgi:hypothetical protein
MKKSSPAIGLETAGSRAAAMKLGKVRPLLGTMAIAFYAAHAAVWIGRGVPAGMLWACHLGCLMTGVALLADAPLLNAVGVLWLALGNVLWIVDLVNHGEFIATSPLTHIGGILIGIWFAKRRGFPRNAWLAALLGLAALHVVSRPVSPPAENINLAFRVWGGCSKVFPNFWFFRLFLLASAAAFFYALERGARRFLAPRPPTDGVRAS